ncbi:hypothetical protein COY65_02385, partial [Candidatus Jorgensenbacteria bacterium CG_4_10_14_0_8_um_filter_39_13]
MKNFKSQSGFSLMELLIYVAIFTGSAVLLTAILSSTGRIQVRQSAVDELNQQTFFIQSTIQRLVREASLIENPAGVASTTLKLRMSSSTLDPTLIYTDASNTAIYLKQGNGSASALTNDKAKISSFSITKYENPGGLVVVQVDLTLAYNSTDPRKQFSRDLKIAISRVSAATFDSDLVPNIDNTYSVGIASYSWKNGYFSGNVGIGTTAPAQKLHVEGQCITGDSLLSVVSAKDYESGRAESQKLKAEKIPIKDITSDYYVYSLNQQTGELELQKINKLLDMGVKPVFKLTTESGKTIRTTGNHPYLIKKQNYDQQQRELLAFRRIESLAREYGLDSQDLSADREFSQIRTLWSNQPDQESSQFGSSQYSRGQGQKDGQGTKTISDSSQGLASR